MKTIDIGHGEYASKWGLTDFYPESEAKLKEALASGEDFTTGWFGCEKEIRYAEYTRDAEAMTVKVSCVMDDLWESNDLIWDAWYETYHEDPEDELPHEIIDSIRDAAIDAGINDGTDIERTLPREAGLEDIVKATRDLEAEAEANNHRMFSDLVDIVKAHWEYMPEEKEELK